MSIWELCVRRPVFTVMLVCMPIVLGIASYGRLGVEMFPNVDVPVVTVTTLLRGASAEEMETRITKPIEEIVNTVSGIDELRSTTKEGFSQVVLSFILQKNGDVAAQEVDAKVRTMLSQLPPGTEAPIIDKLAIDAVPILTIAISGQRDVREVTEIARKDLKENIESLPGVGSVTLVGGRPRAIHVIIDVERLQKVDKLTIEDVRRALLTENREDPGGRVDRLQSELTLRTLGRIENASDFENLIVTNRKGQPIRINDIGWVEDTFEEPRGSSRLWIRGESADDSIGDNAVSLVITKQSGTNAVAMVDVVRARLAELQKGLPSDIKMEVIRDQSRFIRSSIEEVKTHLLLAVILVSASILLFLRDWRTTMIATMAIPTSIIGSVAFIYAMGFSLNNFTLMALIMAVGIVVDDAVVVHENIFRHMEEYGKSAWEATLSATKEIALPVLATTLSLVVIFAPIAFMGGQVGRFFSCFGWTIGFAVMLSMLISFTMTPMLCSRFLKLDPTKRAHSKSGFIWKLLENGYVAILAWSLRNRWAIVCAGLLVLFSTPILLGIVGFDFVPQDDQSEFEVLITLPEGYTLNRADAVFNEIDLRLRKLRGVTHSYIVIGDTSGRITKGQGDVTSGSIYCRMVDITERKYSQFDVMNDAREIMADYPDLRIAVQVVPLIQAQGFREVDIDLNLIGPDTAKLQVISEQAMDWMRKQGGYVDIDTSLSLRKPELRIRPNRERLSDQGVTIEDVSRTTNILVGGEPVSKFKEGGEQYDIWLRASLSGRDDIRTIGQIGVPSSKVEGGVVLLGNVVDFENALGPNTIERSTRQRQVVISSNLQGKAIGDAVTELGAFLDTIEFPPGYRYEFIGRAKTMKESNDNFLLGFALAFLFMYMILAAQFESFVHPISILIGLPLTVPFAILSLILMGTRMDLYAMFGLFMLFGIVKKNGIMQVDYTNQLRKRGLPRDEAILEANRTRFRPILMTTVMLIAAMIPMALGEGPGAGARASMAKVILGGQALSLLLTLLVTPVAYSIWDSWGNWAKRRFQPNPERERAGEPDTSLTSEEPHSLTLGVRTNQQTS